MAKVHQLQKVQYQARLLEFYESLLKRVEEDKHELDTELSTKGLSEGQHKEMKGYLNATIDICNEFGLKFIDDHKWIR